MEQKIVNAPELGGKFSSEEVEPVTQKLMEVLKDLPNSLAGIALLTTLFDLSRNEAAKSGAITEDTDFGGFQMECNIKGFTVNVTAVNSSTDIFSMLADLMGVGENDEAIENLKEMMWAKDDPLSPDYCDCEACEERRALMTEHKVPVKH